MIASRSGRDRRRGPPLRGDVIVLCHGGPIATPEDAAASCTSCRNVPRILRRQFDGAAADRAGNHRNDSGIQASGFRITLPGSRRDSEVAFTSSGRQAPFSGIVGSRTRLSSCTIS